MTTLQDLFQFLHSPNPDARQLALENLIGHTPKSSPNRSIFIPSGSTPLWEDLETSGLGGKVKDESVREEETAKVGMLRDLKMLCRDQAVSGWLELGSGEAPTNCSLALRQMIAHDSLSALINLSDTILVAKHLVDPDWLGFLVSYTAVSQQYMYRQAMIPSLIPDTTRATRRIESYLSTVAINSHVVIEHHISRDPDAHPLQSPHPHHPHAPSLPSSPHIPHIPHLSTFPNTPLPRTTILFPPLPLRLIDHPPILPPLNGRTPRIPRVGGRDQSARAGFRGWGGGGGGEGREGREEEGGCTFLS